MWSPSFDRGGYGGQNDPDQIRFDNDSGEEIPARSFVFLNAITDGVYKGIKPDADSIDAARLAVTGNYKVPSGSTNVPATLCVGKHFIVDMNSASPVNGDDIGTTEDQWYGTIGKTGFKALGALGGRARISPFSAKAASESWQSVGYRGTGFPSAVTASTLASGSTINGLWASDSGTITIGPATSLNVASNIRTTSTGDFLAKVLMSGTAIYLRVRFQHELDFGGTTVDVDTYVTNIYGAASSGNMRAYPNGSAVSTIRVYSSLNLSDYGLSGSSIELTRWRLKVTNESVTSGGVGVTIEDVGARSIGFYVSDAVNAIGF